jgi:hypothetical protein
MSDNNTNTALLSTAYFAPIQYYSKLYSFSNIYIEVYENYCKQTFRNRCNILAANGLLSLSIPVNKGNELKSLTKDVKIDHDSRWISIHLRAIESAYRSSPFYMYYIDDLTPILNKKHEFLIDLNFELQNTILDLLGFKPIIETTTNFKQTPIKCIDLTEAIHPKESKKKPDNSFRSENYYQVFSEKYGFLPNLSILDLLFNMGPSSIEIIEKCSIKI